MAWDILIIKTPTNSVSICVCVQFCQGQTWAFKLQTEVNFKKRGHADQP